MQTRTVSYRKRIALVAHDKKKAELLDWSLANKALLSDHELFATGTTGKMLEEKLQLPVTKLLSGPLGGDQQMGGLIAEGRIDAIMLFWDPLEAQPHDNDVKALMRLAAVWNILMACNRSTADFIMRSELMRSDYELQVPDYGAHLNRKF